MNIIWLDDTGCQEVSRVGGKVANLSQLAAEYQVPHGFCLTTDAFRQWASHADGSTEEFHRSCCASLAAFSATAPWWLVNMASRRWSGPVWRPARSRTVRQSTWMAMRDEFALSTEARGRVAHPPASGLR